ncbi:MAG: hypothetical protein WBF53_01185 [Litorimonas sp.]
MSLLRKTLAIVVLSIPAIVVAAMALSASMQAAKDRFLIRSGNDAYWEFREFLETQDRMGETLWFDCCADRRGWPSTSVLPMYTEHWTGLSKVWTGDIAKFDVSGNSRLYPGPQDVVSGLVAFDQTRTDWDTMSPSALADEFGLDWKTAWVSPHPWLGRIIVFDPSQSRTSGKIVTALNIPPLDSDSWKTAGVTKPEAIDSVSELMRMVGETTEKTEFARTAIKADLAPSEYKMEFEVKEHDPSIFVMVRLDVIYETDESSRHDIRLQLHDQDPIFRARALLAPTATLGEDGLFSISASLLLTKPAKELRISIYPSAGVDFPRFSESAVGGLTMSTPRITYNKPAP